MSDELSVDPEKPIEQDNPPSLASAEAQSVNVTPPTANSGESPSAVRRGQRGAISLICGVASIVLAPLTLLPGPIAWVGYLGLVATLIALLAARGVLRRHGEADQRERKLAQAGVGTGMLGLVTLVALFALGSMQAAQQSTALLKSAMAPPKAFENADLTLSYPGGWQAADASQKAECKNQAFECVIWLDAPLGNGRFVILRYPDPGVETVDEFDQLSWAVVKAEGPSIELVSRQELQVDQRQAFQRILTRPAPDDPNRRVYNQIITTASDGIIYQFLGAAGDSAAFDSHRPTFDTIVQSIDFKVPSVVQATPAPKVYEDENFTLTYPRHWTQSGTTSGCVDCPVLVHAYRDGSNVTLVLQHFPAPEKTADEASQSWWRAITDQTSGVVLESRQPIEVDQRPAIKLIYHDPGASSYSMGVVLMDAGEAYVLGASAKGQAAFNEHQAEIEDIINNLRFKHPPQIATATPASPTATPIPKNTPAADLSAIKITLTDLPATFGELSQPELAKELEANLAQAITQGSASAKVASFGAYATTDDKNLQIFMSVVFYPLDKGDTASFDAIMGQSDMMLQAIAGSMTGQTGNASVAPLKGSDQLGDNSIGGTVVGDKIKADVIIMRRGAALSFVMLFYDATAKPGANVVKLAGTLDQRLQAALK